MGSYGGGRGIEEKVKDDSERGEGEKGMEMIHDLPKWAYIQALLSRGDRRVGKILMAAHQAGGDWGRPFERRISTLTSMSIEKGIWMRSFLGISSTMASRKSD